jgi:hypothetical protein
LAFRTDDTTEDPREITAARDQVRDVIARLQSREGDAFGGLAVRVAIAVDLRSRGISNRGGDGFRNRRGTCSSLPKRASRSRARRASPQIDDE